ncbi:lantibiotic dehydratase C-terminal domain-containing protein [Actinosynnema sp. NPDC047251]|uniref:lantibiotic dehydratase C-terminal domain-containing protein n=1 Tax=Saccharothrix espanaensis TaxID=103731 RepID=UPI00130DDD34|nr:lantibiotic dehydratase C-terminal domain-containing protein [Saccharothrix espanaensis]
MSVHVCAHSDLDRQLPVLLPAAARVHEEFGLGAWFFLRYWDGGPHVRIRLLCADREQRTRAMSRLDGEFRRWAERNPEPRALTVAEYERSVAWIRARETGTGVVLPLRASRTWWETEFDGEWMPGGPSCTDAPRTLRFLKASSAVALRAHRQHSWGERFRHGVDVLRHALREHELGPEMTVWAERLAGDQAAEVRRRCRAQSSATPQDRPPAAAAVAVAGLCSDVAGELGGVDAFRHAWHTHCNRLGLTLLDEAAAAWMALMSDAEVTR